jgi:hypothetical protein
MEKLQLTSCADSNAFIEVQVKAKDANADAQSL